MLWSCGATNAQPPTTAFPVMAKSYPLPPLVEVQRELSYCPDTGNLYWIRQRATITVGAVAGTTQVDGYRRIMLYRKRYKAHRLAWLLYYSEDPGDRQIDHIDGNRSNNAISNLRICLQHENSANVRIKKNNTSGTPGVSYHKKTGKWRAYIMRHRKQHYLGLFSRLKDAVEARDRAAVLLHGEFARLYGVPD